MMMLPASNFRFLLLKSGPGSGAKIANQAGFAFYGTPPRWHKITADKPAPKGAPVSAHPESAGKHAPAAHFTDDQWAALKLPDSNVNAPSYNKALDKLKEWSDAGNVTAIVGAGYGSNTYGKKLAAVANHLLGMHGSAHKVEAGQKPGTHGGVQSAPAAPLPDLDSPEDMAADYTKPSATPAPAAPDAPDGTLKMPDFDEGKTVTGVKALYEKVAQKLMDHAHAGNLSVVEDMPEPSKKMWQGKTANSKKLLALHAQAVASLNGKGVPGIDPAVPTLSGDATGPGSKDGSIQKFGISDADAILAPGWGKKATAGAPAAKKAVYEAATYDLIGIAKNVKSGASAKNGEKVLVIRDKTGPVAALSYNVHETPLAGKALEIIIVGSVSPGAGKKLIEAAAAEGEKHGLPVHLKAAEQAIPFYESMGFKFGGIPKDEDDELTWMVMDGPKEGDTKPAADGGTLVLKNGHWVKQGGDDPVATNPEHFEFNTGDVFKLDSQYQKMNAGEWTIYNISPDGTQVYMHKVGAKVPNQTNSATIPASTLAEAIAKGTAKKQGGDKPAATSTQAMVDAIAQSSAAPEHKKAAIDAVVKQAAAGTLSAQQLGNLQSIPWFKQKLPDSNTNAKSHNAAVAKIEAMAFAGDTAGLQAFIDAKSGAKQTYAKKQVLLAQTALAGLGVDGATAAVPVEPEPAVLQGPTVNTPVPADVKTVVDGLAAKGDTGALSSIAIYNKQSSPHVAAYAQKKLDEMGAAPPSEKVTSLTAAQVKGLHGWMKAGKPTSKHPDSWSNLWKKLSPNMKAAVKAEMASEAEPAAPAAAAPASLAGKPAYDFIAQTKKKNGYFEQDLADAWLEANPGAWDELNEGLIANGYASIAEYGPPPGAASKYPVVDEWKKAVSAGKIPTKAQAEAYEALVEHDPDAAQEAFMDAVNALIPPEHNNDEMFDDALQAAHEKAYELHDHALKGTKQPASPVTADTPLGRKQLAALESLSQDDLEAIQDSPGLPVNVKAWVNKKLAGLKQTAAEKPAAKIKVDAPLYENTTDGHNKFWSVSTNGKVLKTEYGKIGAMGTSTVKEFPTEQAAKSAAVKLMEQKKANGYVYKGSVKHEHDAVEQGPKEGDTKQGADGMLVLKNGHWVKVGEDLGGWDFTASNPGLSGEPSLEFEKDGMAYYVAGSAASGYEFASMSAESIGDAPDESFVGSTLAEAVEQAAAAGLPVPPAAALQKLDPSYKPVAGAENSSQKASATAQKASAGGIPAMDSWVQTGGQGGSNPGGKFKDPSGQEWYVKWPDDAEAVKSEVLAAKLYALAGLSSQDCMLVTKGGKTAIASKWVSVKKANSATALAKVDGVHQGFAVDAWLGNWDVVGLSLDNLQIGPDGKAHRVDAGGSLEYRAQGEKKPFGPKVEEIETLRDPTKNPKAAAVFGKMTQADITASVAKVAALDDDMIRAVVMQHGPGDDAARAKLADTLIARKADLLAQFPKAKPAEPKKSAPVFRIPDRPDFSNWNGPGQGLSSKPALNKQNDELTAEMFKLGNAGNVEKLKAMTFQPIDTNGNPVGEPTPILQHPSKHIVAYFKDVLHAMQTPYVSPKIALEEAKKSLSGAFKAIGALFPGFKSLKESAIQVGRYALLGKAKAANPLAGWKPALKSRKQGTIDEVGLFKASQKGFASLSAVERQAIRDYTGSSYTAMNNALLQGKSHDKAYHATKGMEKASVPLPPGTVLSRRFSLDKDSDGNQSKAVHDANIEKLLSAGEGAILQDFGIISTSCRSSFWSGYVHLKITVGEGVKGLYVATDPSGKGVPPISKNPGESEIMLPPGTRFMVTKIHPKGHSFSDETGEWGSKGHEQVIEVTVLPNI